MRAISAQAELEAGSADPQDRRAIARARVLISGALAAAKLLETGELAERIAALEAALAQDRADPPDALFPDESAP